MEPKTKATAASLLLSFPVVKSKRSRFFSQNFELLAWSLILLVFVAGIAQVTRGQLETETALGLSEQEFAGSPEIGR